MRKKRCCIISSRFSTISSQFFAIYISIFHKTEVLTVILRGWTGLNPNNNWFKSYDTKHKWGSKRVGPFHSSQFLPLVFIPLCWKWKRILHSEFRCLQIFEVKNSVRNRRWLQVIFNQLNTAIQCTMCFYVLYFSCISICDTK